MQDNAAKHEAMATGEQFSKNNIPEYIGIMTLPKFNNQAVYQLRQNHNRKQAVS